ncbi:MAG: hypothetical protein WC254_05040 [Candidatus Woesearchaeota archaeon]|jgi:hypothetical protein
MSNLKQIISGLLVSSFLVGCNGSKEVEEPQTKMIIKIYASERDLTTNTSQKTSTDIASFEGYIASSTEADFSVNFTPEEQKTIESFVTNTLRTSGYAPQITFVQELTNKCHGKAYDLRLSDSSKEYVLAYRPSNGKYPDSYGLTVVVNSNSQREKAYSDTDVDGVLDYTITVIDSRNKLIGMGGTKSFLMFEYLKNHGVFSSTPSKELQEQGEYYSLLTRFERQPSSSLHCFK